MAFPKVILFPEKDQQIGKVGKVLGHPARVSILKILKKHRRLYVMDIVHKLPLSEGTVSEHLRKLREAGLIRVEEKGLFNRYTLDMSGLRLVDEALHVFMEELLAGIDRGHATNST